MDFVVGSGPAGIACVKALVRAGRKVTILDSGIQLEDDRKASICRLQQIDKKQWTEGETAFLREGISSSTSGIPLKRAFGSDYPYRIPPGATKINCRVAETKPSFAYGGLSTVWGAATMPYRRPDIADWPISIEDLEPGYKAVLEWMPLSAQIDALAEFFPLYTDRNKPLPSSRQAQALSVDMQRSRTRLNAEGVYWGGSRIAVRAEGPAAEPACVQCGLCMYGCPHELIYSSDQTFKELIEEGQVIYRSGVTVHSVEESAREVKIQAFDREGAPLQFSAGRVFLCAGLLNTTSILLRSLNRYDTPVEIKDSQYFLMPLLRMRGVSGVMREPLHTLAQLFVEVFDEKISPFTIHLQTYTYNDLFRAPVLAALGPLRSIFPVEALLGRLMLFQGYLHSSHSAGLTAQLTRGSQGDTLEVGATPNPQTVKRIGQLSRKFLSLAMQTGLLPLLPAIQKGQPGRGFHSGGSFAMSRDPNARQSDLLGRPAGLLRVHAVDSTVLPSIPATTITYSVMANAYRIAMQAAHEFPGE
jgi:choline dehydrogenase-like flavoprotein